MQDLNESEPGKFIVYVDSDIREIIPIFLSHRSRDVNTINVALEQKNFEAIQELGHKMKGTGSGYGFDHISEMGDQLEQAARNADTSTIRGLIDNLVNYLDNLEIVWIIEED